MLGISQFLQSGLAIPIIAIVMGCLVAMVAIIGGVAHSIATSRAKEATRRELAAYVAEGSMQPDTAIALMKAGRADDDEDCGACA